MAYSGAKLFQKKLCSILPQKASRIRFSNKHVFDLNFCTKSHLTYFFWPNGIDSTIGGKSVPERSFVHPKKHVFGWNFLTKPVPYLFSGPNWLYNAFGGKIVPNENFAQFCLNTPIEFIFPKNTFSV